MVFPISSYNKDRVNTYIDLERTLKKLKDNDYLFYPENNTDFLNLKEDDEKCPYNIFNCIREKAKEEKLELKWSIENNIVYEILTATQNGFVISILK